MSTIEKLHKKINGTSATTVVIGAYIYSTFLIGSTLVTRKHNSNEFSLAKLLNFERETMLKNMARNKKIDFRVVGYI